MPQFGVKHTVMLAVAIALQLYNTNIGLDFMNTIEDLTSYFQVKLVILSLSIYDYYYQVGEFLLWSNVLVLIALLLVLARAPYPFLYTCLKKLSWVLLALQVVFLLVLAASHVNRLFFIEKLIKLCQKSVANYSYYVRVLVLGATNLMKNEAQQYLRGCYLIIILYSIAQLCMLVFSRHLVNYYIKCRESGEENELEEGETKQD